MTVVGSLCSGYGGLDMGLALALGPVEHAWFVEYDKHPSAILAHRFPGVPNYGDVKTTDWTAVERVDWLTAGYPCQPFSHAGKRAGADDPRHLWPAVAHAIGVLRPGNVLLENVAGHVSLGLADVLADLSGLGNGTPGTRSQSCASFADRSSRRTRRSALVSRHAGQRVRALCCPSVTRSANCVDRAPAQAALALQLLAVVTGDVAA